MGSASMIDCTTVSTRSLGGGGGIVGSGGGGVGFGSGVVRIGGMIVSFDTITTTKTMAATEMEAMNAPSNIFFSFVFIAAV